MSIDETMSQDVAFTKENESDLFKFDEVGETSPDSQPKEEDKEADSVVAEDNINEEEQKVPYSRFKKKVDEVNEYASKVSSLEERLQELENHRQESKPEEVDIPSEWKELYGDSEASKKAWVIQRKREEEIEERAIRRVLESVQNQQAEEYERIEENEQIIDETLSELQETIGRKLSPKQEEELLSIVDEFSPVGKDGKYISLFPFDKAYEIYTLRNTSKGLGTRQARQNVADLTSNTSKGEADSSESQFKRGWDNWREAL